MPLRGEEHGHPTTGPVHQGAIAVPEVEVRPLATLAAASQDGWAVLLAEGHSHKREGDVSDVLWWVIKTVRFEAGELDPYGTSIRRLDRDAAVGGPLPLLGGP